MSAVEPVSVTFQGTKCKSRFLAKAEVAKFPLPCPRQARTQRALGQHPKFRAVPPFLLPGHKGGALLTCRAQGAVQKVWQENRPLQIRNQSLLEFKSGLGHSVKERKLSAACYTLKAICWSPSQLQVTHCKQVLHIVNSHLIPDAARALPQQSFTAEMLSHTASPP